MAFFYERRKITMDIKTVSRCHTVGFNDAEWYTPLSVTDKVRYG